MSTGEIAHAHRDKPRCVYLAKGAIKSQDYVDSMSIGSRIEIRTLAGYGPAHELSRVTDMCATKP